MPKKADILPEHSIHHCQQCTEYLHCYSCNRGVCAYLAVSVYQDGEFSGEKWCRVCCEGMGWNEDEIASQAIDIVTGLSGEAIHEARKAKTGVQE